jgi:hypothetical protein
MGHIYHEIHFFAGTHFEGEPSSDLDPSTRATFTAILDLAYV